MCSLSIKREQRMIRTDVVCRAVGGIQSDLRQAGEHAGCQGPLAADHQGSLPAAPFPNLQGGCWRRGVLQLPAQHHPCWLGSEDCRLCNIRDLLKHRIFFWFQAQSMASCSNAFVQALCGCLYHNGPPLHCGGLLSSLPPVGVPRHNLCWHTTRLLLPSLHCFTIISEPDRIHVSQIMSIHATCKDLVCIAMEF